MRWLSWLLGAMLLTTAAGLVLADRDGPAGPAPAAHGEARDRGGNATADRDAHGDDGGADASADARGDARSEADRHEDREDEREHGPAFHEDQDKWVLRNDNVTVWFHGGEDSKPALQVMRTGSDGNKTGFRLALDSLFEARPAAQANDTDASAAHGDRDDAGDQGEGAAFHRVRDREVNLEPSRDWATNVTNGTDEITITMTNDFRQGNVTLVFHVPKDGAAVKFDVDVQGWKWVDANDSLALRLQVLGRGARQEGDNATFDVGFVSWSRTATATYPDGHTATLAVDGQVQEHADGAHILLRFVGPGGYSGLAYDPTFGVASSGSQLVPGFDASAAVAVLGALGAAAVIARRR